MPVRGSRGGSDGCPSLFVAAANFIFSAAAASAAFFVVALPAQGLSQVATAGQTRGSMVISGSVADAQSSSPVAGAVLRLSWQSGDARAGGTLQNCRGANQQRTMADARGAYRFENLGSGSYCIIVFAPGYKGDTAGVELRGSDIVSQFYLQPVPQDIAGVRVEAGNAGQTFRLPDSRFADSLGLRFRIAVGSAGFLTPDVRVVSSRDVSEAITLAEADLMRSLQRIPGVGTRDDYTATTWTRGAPWDQTRVYMDGLALYNPTHAGWLFGSINPEGVGRFTYMPGVRPAWIGEGAAGVISLESRRGGAEGETQFSTELSVVSARFAADGPLPGRDAGWMISLRRTYIDLLTSAMESVGADSVKIPYDFADAIARVDLQLPFGFRAEASGVYERDDLRGDFPGILRRNQADWGNRAGRVTLARNLSGAELKVTGGVTRFGTRLLELVEEETPPDTDPTLPSLSNGLSHWTGTLELASLLRPGAGARPHWSVGLHYSVQEAEYDGPFSLTAEGIPGIDRDQVIRIPFLYQAELKMGALWAQRLFPLGDRLTLDLGVRAEQSARVANAGSVRVAPRGSARFAIDSATDLSFGVARSFQYAQDVGAAAGPLGPQLHLTHIWQLASVGVPAVRSDITTLGLERRLFGVGVLMSANAYYRHSTGMTVPDPTPGEIRADRPLFKVAENEAVGLELSVRKLAGPWSGSAGYALADSRLSADGFTFPSPADVRHSLDFTLSRRLSDRFRLSGAYSYSSGVPYTRLVIGETALRLEAPYARRSAAYASADLSLDYSAAVGPRTISAYVQIRNLFNRRNPVTYSGSPETCVGSRDENGVCAGSLIVNDRFDTGIPMLPLFGVRLVF